MSLERQALYVRKTKNGTFLSFERPKLSFERPKLSRASSTGAGFERLLLTLCVACRSSATARGGGVQKPPPFGRPEGRAPPPPLHPWTALPAQRLCSRKRRGESRPSAGLGAEPRPHRSARGRLCLCPRARYAACGQTHPPTGSTPPTLVKKTLKSSENSPPEFV